MKRTTAWDGYVRRAAEQLSRVCAETAEQMSGGEGCVREIRELAGAVKELVALRTALEKEREKGDGRSGVQVSFDRDGEVWKQ